MRVRRAEGWLLSNVYLAAQIVVLPATLIAGLVATGAGFAAGPMLRRAPVATP